MRPPVPATLETPRLRLRPPTADDVVLAFSWLGDPQVMQYYPGGHDRTLEQARTRWTRYVEHQAARGYSKWVVINRATDEIVGDAGLMNLHEPGTGWIDLGYRFKPNVWGQGFATEVAKGWIQAAPGLGLTELGAFAHVDNLRSLNVLRKVGFVETRRDTIMTIPVVVFRLELERA